MEKRFCRNCGGELQKNVRVCHNCNTQTSDIAPIILKYGLQHCPDYYVTRSYFEELDIMKLLNPNLYNYWIITFISSSIAAFLEIISFIKSKGIFTFSPIICVVFILYLFWIVFIGLSYNLGYRRMWNNAINAIHSILFILSTCMTISFISNT